MSRRADVPRADVPRADGPRPGPSRPGRRARSPRGTRARPALAAAGLGVAALLLMPVGAQALPSGESWGAELVVSGGDDVNVALVAGAVRLVAPSTATARSTGVLVLAPRRPAAATDTVAADLTADLPPGTDSGVDVRGVLSDGSWSDWLPATRARPAVLPEATTEVQARIRLLGGPGLVSPAVQQLWLTTSTGAGAPTTPAPSTTARPTPSGTVPGGTVPTGTVPTGAPPATTAPTTTTRPAPATTTPPRTTTPGATTPGATASGTAAPATTRPGTTTSGTTTSGTTTSGTTTSGTTAPGGTVPATAARPLWDAAITAEGTGCFNDTPWNFVGGKGEKPSAAVVPDGTTGRRAIRFTMPAGGTRAELEPNTDNYVEGSDRWFRLSVRLAPGFPTDPGTWQVISQWKNDGTGSPPLELRVQDGKYVLGGGFGHPAGSRLFSRDLGPAVPGTATDLVVHVAFSADPAKGEVDVWQDGRQVVDGLRPPGGTLYPGNGGYRFSYWKIGLYRDSEITTPGVMDLLAARVGTSSAAVAGP